MCITPLECTSNNDCTGTKICVNNTCVFQNYECVNDEDCLGEEICEDNQCVNSSYVCVSDSDCYGTEICENNSCVEPEPECYYDNDCPGDEECVAGNCLSPTNGSEEEYCVVDNDCTGTKICIYGICSDNEVLDCEEDGYFCMSSTNCIGYEVSSGYSESCYSPFICCSEGEELKSCSDQSGDICYSDEICVGGIEVDSSDLETGEVCCTSDGICKEDTGAGTKDDDCEDKGGECRINNCEKNEEASLSYTCSIKTDTCCVAKDKKIKGAIILIILLFLVLLVVLGIIFRDKLKLYWIKLKSKLSGNKLPSKRSSMMNMPSESQKRPFLRRIFPMRKPVQATQQMHPSHNAVMPNRPVTQERPMPSSKPAEIAKPVSRPTMIKKTTPKPKPELDDVLKKLKEMGK